MCFKRKIAQAVSSAVTSAQSCTDFTGTTWLYGAQTLACSVAVLSGGNLSFAYLLKIIN